MDVRSTMCDFDFDDFIWDDPNDVMGRITHQYDIWDQVGADNPKLSWKLRYSVWRRIIANEVYE